MSETASLQEKLNAFEFFHQRWEVEPGVFTPGGNDIVHMFDKIGMPQDLTGKRVIDIGAWNGCASFECERRGAREVVAVDLQDPEPSGFNFLKEHLNSKVTYVQDSAYNLNPEEFGTFDVILFFGVLYHLRYPLLAVDRIRSICQDNTELYVETHVVTPNLFFRKNESLNESLDILKLCETTDTPIWRFYEEFECHPGDPSNWFGPNIPAVIQGFDSGGFKTEHTNSWQDRASFRAVISKENEERMYNTQEGLSPINRDFIGLKKEMGKNPLFG